MAKGYRLPAADIARMNRVVTAYEAGERTDASRSSYRHPVLTMFLLNGAFEAPEDDDGAGDGEYQYGRRFAAEALRCETTRLRVQTLRIRNLDWDEPTPFRFEFEGRQTPELDDDLTAAELQQALIDLVELPDVLGVIGYQSNLGTDDAPITYAARQWHILYADDFDAITLPGLADTGHNLRLYRDWWIPTAQAETVWTGLPSDIELEPGAFGWCLPFDPLGWTWIHGECRTRNL